MNEDTLKKKISIGMCAYNSELTIKHSIESVISQSFTNWELIIMDDNSSDNTMKIIDYFSSLDHRIIYINKKIRQGWMNSSIQVLDIASGDFFMWLDADDVISPQWLQMLLCAVENGDKICSIGLLNLVDLNRTLVTNNPSSLRAFKFTTNNFALIRVFFAILIPESFGLVNVLYGLWKIDKLKFVRESTVENSDLRHDQIFLFNALKSGKISYVKGVFHFRRVLPRKNEIDKLYSIRFKKKYFFRYPRRIQIIEYIWRCLNDMPPINIYFNWIIREKSLAKYLYLSALLLRFVVAFPFLIIKEIIKFIKPNY
jgi:glycosyltransferase involved in cell wall biosynthesis